MYRVSSRLGLLGIIGAVHLLGRGATGDLVMDVFNSSVEWFNGLLGLEYAGYGPVMAIILGIFTVFVCIHILKFFFRPFAPLFQTAEEIGELNPVLAQQGIRQSQLVRLDERCQDEQREGSELIGRLREPATKTRPSHAEPDFEALSPANDPQDIDERDFSDSLEDAWQHDQSAELREEIAPLRSSRAAERNGGNGASVVSSLNLRPTAAKEPAGPAIPLICITNFGDNSRSCGAAHRISLRLGQGVTETLARIPGLAVEMSDAAGWNGASQSSGPVFVVEGRVDLLDGGVHVDISVRNSSDGSHLLARDMTCNPEDLQKFEKEVALEIAAAVIAHQRPAHRSIMQRLTSSKGGQSGSTYPNARPPSPERPRRTGQQAR